MDEFVFNAVKRLTVGVAPRLMRLEIDGLSQLTVPLTHRQYRILFQISRGRNTITRVREVAGTSLAAISESVESLHRRGLITRCSDVSDRRVTTLKLTEDGKKALAAAEMMVDRLVTGIVRSMTLNGSAATEFSEGISQVDAIVAEQHRLLGQSKKR